MTDWVAGMVVENRRWTDRLHSLRIEAAVAPFKAGQYTRLALDIDGVKVARPYSFVNPPQEPVLEFYFNSVPGGPLSNQLLAIKEGEPIWVAPEATGFLTLDEVPEAEDLWLLATGTAIGPFLSILATEEPWRRFQRIRLAYSVRHGVDMSYRERLDAHVKERPGQFDWIPCISREQMADSINGRITTALADGRLEQRAGCALGPEQSQVMICGNPHMVKETIALLKERGMQKNLRRAPGHITVERYW
ncbi:ferredoxin--NADP reductase [Motiliproteus sp. SC1-56]|uniref:ferredoxin--NADP reductase n=1 Tax=Motiliproteus sp. SC1-56 TaxID=2799565 RepID=UPI001A901728|nr:ferredoxin--NADP reductase [Motiliproteus sp. SC1-56]